ncbi:MAG: MFS transporter [Chloroflexi bacterium]|nr:MFS transporter [Chloroflexota bacterium]
MPGKDFRLYRYRWVVLGVFMFVNLTIQILWICFAAITGPAASYYGVTDLQIGFLAMSFMLVYIPLSIPISWIIDTYGFRKAVSAGAVLMGVFGLARGVFASNYSLVVACTLGIAAAQPFLLNAITTVAARWFPVDERATASGLAMVASFLGIAAGMVLTPILFLQYGIGAMLLIYGGVAAFSSVLFVVLSREAPPTPPCEPGQEERALMLDGLKNMLKIKEIWFLLFLFLVGMGVFNGISTWVEEIVRPRGFSITQAGDLGGFMLIGGIAGAAILPALSDKYRNRKLFLLLGMTMSIPGLLGVTFAASYGIMAASMSMLGFFMMGLAPIGYQYAAEITFPAPEGTSNGLLNLAGQASVVFIFSMEAFKSPDGSFTRSLLAFVGLMVVCVFLIASLRESSLIKAQIADQQVVENTPQSG